MLWGAVGRKDLGQVGQFTARDAHFAVKRPRDGWHSSADDTAIERRNGEEQQN
jgi:hypothetical protein